MDRRLRSTAAAAACALAALAGCASNRTTAADRRQPPAPTDTGARPAAAAASLARLQTLADRQSRSPVASAVSAPPPPGIESSVAQPLSAADEVARLRALQPLDDVVQLFAVQHPEGAIARNEPDAEDAESALRLYVSGRQKALQGDAAGAVVDLRKATRLDPTSGEPWRELGEAQLATGARAEAAISFEKAAARGLNDPRVLELLGRWALERRDARNAAAYLCRAFLASPHRADPLLPQVIGVALWRALSVEGYVTAARDALRHAVERPAELSSSTRYGSEYSSILRRQGDLWREIGDADVRLGDYQAAVNAYARADDLPSLEGKSLIARQVFAQMRSGRPAAAAVAVLTPIMDSGGRAAPESVDLLRYLANNAGLGGEISDALQSFRQNVPQPASVSGGLARAQAAVAGPEKGRTILRDQVRAHPGDLTSAVDLFNLIGDPVAATTEAARLCADHPTHAGRLSEALLRSILDIDASIAALDRAAPREAAALVLAYLHAARGDTAKATALVAGLKPSARYAPATALAQVELGLVAGNGELAQQGLERLAQGSGPEWTRAHARGLAWMQRTRAALPVLEGVLTDRALSTDERMDDLLLASDLAVGAGRDADAERWIKDAAALDPFDDRAQAHLLNLYSTGGPMPDQGKLNLVVRDLRQDFPESRVLRAAKIKELVRRGMVAQAETDAAALADEDPSDGSVIDLAAAVWRARYESGDAQAIDRAKQWFDDHLKRRPHSPVLLAGLTALLTASDESEEAESRLRAALDSGGGPDVSRLLERVLREVHKRPDEADALTAARLEGKAPTVPESLELADFDSRHGRDLEAAAIISTIPDEVTLSSEQGARLLVIASQIGQQAIQKADQPRLAAAAGIFDMAAKRSIKFPPEAHQQRLAILAGWEGSDQTRIFDAINAAAPDLPPKRSAPGQPGAGIGADDLYLLVAKWLIDAKREPLALQVVARGTEEARDPDLGALRGWFGLIANAGEPVQLKPLIAQAERAGKLQDLVAVLRPQTDRASAPKDWRAELAYVLAGSFTVLDRPNQATGALELCLEYDPDHALACNDLGYFLADKGQDIPRASRLLEKAHAALPENTAVTDSLGWLRYKQGLLNDQTDAASGKVTRAGALSLLQTAAQTPRGQDDPTILDHLGDALWLAGRAPEAVRLWEQAERLTSRASGGERQEYKTLNESAGTKRRAAAAGTHVHVAPQLADPDPKPAPTASGDGVSSAPATGSATAN